MNALRSVAMAFLMFSRIPMPLLDMALAVYDGMVTFDHLGLKAYEVDLK